MQMTDEEQESRPAKRSEFPIFSYEEYFEFKRQAFQVGLKSTYPEEFIRRIAAARISYQMGNRSIGYTYKRYLEDASYDVNDGSRLDLRISNAIKHRMALLDELIHRITEHEPKVDGQILAEWTFLRIPFSIKFLLTCANRGAFFESIAIARMMLEQIAWASKIDRFTDVDEIAKTSATKAIRSFARICPVVGRLYGWMSLHAHWAFEGHVKAMRVDEDGKTQSLFATTEFKARALALTLLMSIIAVQVFRTMRAETLEQALSRPDLEEFDIRSFGSKHRPLNAQLSPENSSGMRILRRL
jgi:hypothetical protein